MFKLENKILGYTSDSGANYVLAGKLLGEQFFKSPLFFQLRCFAHGFNTIVHHSLQNYPSKAIDKLRNIVMKIRKSTFLMQELTNYQRQNKFSDVKPKLDVITR